MGCWGMGLAQTDEFCEVYDDFMERYDEGKEPAQISEEILAEQHTEFEDSDGVLHDVYFALAKAEWMCGALSEKIFARVKEIIESGANIEFYRELAATESDLKLRKKNLEKFLTTIQTPREKPRARKKRRQPPPPKELPPVKAGECYRYKYGEGYRIVIILERYKAEGYYDEVRAERIFICVLQKTFAKEELTNIDFLNEKIGIIVECNGDNFLNESNIRKIGEIAVPPKVKAHFFGKGLSYPSKKIFKEPFANPRRITVGRLLSLVDYDEAKPKSLGKYEAGGVYAYEFDGAYRAFAVLDRFRAVNKPELALCAVFQNKYDSFAMDFLKEKAYIIGTYTGEQLAALGQTEKVGEVPMPQKFTERTYGDGIYPIGVMDWFVTDLSYWAKQPLEEIISDSEIGYKQRAIAYEILARKDLTGAEKTK
ncbi:MAG: hypothetical protein IJW21_01185 [Clostridia bacterium]|nr:hypothetical protein [Clostridia bacterium]